LVSACLCTILSVYAPDIPRSIYLDCLLVFRSYRLHGYFWLF
jgi:hypothetical protein